MAEDTPARLDAIDGWPTPEAQSVWLGDPAAEATLRQAYMSGRMQHAWLIGGPKGIGKATLAFRFARFVLANPDPTLLASGGTLDIPTDHGAFRRVAGLAHPDLLVLERPLDEDRKRYRKLLSIEDVRRTVPFFGSTAGEGGWRIAIVDAADDMSVGAANALLKILEEPPPRSLLLIVAHAPGRLLPTIRSRCRRLTLSPLAPETIRRALADSPGVAGASAADLELAGLLSGGSLRRAILLLGGEGIDLYRSFGAITARLPDLDVPQLHAFADRVARRGADDEYETFLEFFADWLDHRVRGVAEPNPASAPGPLAGVSLARWAEVWEKVSDAATTAEMLNLDRKQVVLSAFMTLARASRM